LKLVEAFSASQAAIVWTLYFIFPSIFLVPAAFFDVLALPFVFAVVLLEAAMELLTFPPEALLEAAMELLTFPPEALLEAAMELLTFPPEELVLAFPPAAALVLIFPPAAALEVALLPFVAFVPCN